MKCFECIDTILTTDVGDASVAVGFHVQAYTRNVEVYPQRRYLGVSVDDASSSP